MRGQRVGHGARGSAGRLGGAGLRRAVGLALVSSVLAGCGAASGAPAASPPVDPSVGTVTTTPDGVQEITLQTQDDYVFTPDTFTVAPGQVRLTVVNVAKQMTHNLRFTPGQGPEQIQPEIPLLAAGDRKTIEFTVAQPGEYAFECSFHIQLEQVGTMTVSG